MIGILIIAHGDIAKSLSDGVELIMGKRENYKTLGLFQGDDIELFSKRIQEAVSTLDQGDGVIILTDLFSASPYNKAVYNFRNLVKHQQHILSGMNLPMIIECFNGQILNMPINIVVEKAKKAGINGIHYFNEECAEIINKNI